MDGEKRFSRSYEGSKLFDDIYAAVGAELSTGQAKLVNRRVVVETACEESSQVRGAGTGAVVQYFGLDCQGTAGTPEH